MEDNTLTPNKLTPFIYYDSIEDALSKSYSELNLYPIYKINSNPPIHKWSKPALENLARGIWR